MIHTPFLTESESTLPRYRGKHRAPSNNGRIIATMVGAGVLTTASPAFAHSSVDPDLVREPIIECESGGKNVDRLEIDGESSASGFYQFIDGTWEAYGGTEFAPRAVEATRAEQDIVFDRAIRANGTRDWEADPRSAACWKPKVKNDESRSEGKRSNGKTAEQSNNGKRRDKGSKVPDGYVVVRGDTLGKLAKRFGDPVGDIASANGITNPDRIYVGQKLN